MAEAEDKLPCSSPAQEEVAAAENDAGAAEGVAIGSVGDREGGGGEGEVEEKETCTAVPEAGPSDEGEKQTGKRERPEDSDQQQHITEDDDDGDEEIFEGKIGAASLKSRMYTLQQKCLNSVRLWICRISIQFV